MLNKKGQLGNLQGIVMALVVVGILVGVAFLVLGEFKDTLTVGSTEAVAVNDTINAMKKIPAFLPIIVIVAVVGILLAIVFSVLPRQGTMSA
jgi:hypothetical protein